MAIKNDASESDALGGCLLLLLLLVLSPFGVLFDAFVMLKNYDWFLRSIPGSPNLSLSHMIGFSLIFSMLIFGVSMAVGKIQSAVVEKDKNLMKIAGEGIVRMFAYPAVFWFFGWIYHAMFVK